MIYDKKIFFKGLATKKKKSVIILICNDMPVIDTPM